MLGNIFVIKNLPKINQQKKKRKTRGNHLKQRFRKNFTMLEEELSHPEPNYLSGATPPSSLPPRHFCCVCGFPSQYTCTTCRGVEMRVGWTMLLNHSCLVNVFH
uniref:HIT-type domain-containing protein n=1 Tax=Oreochromis niloticus TaxID=8128 RepID=A0A669ENP6_ORENI